MCAFVIPPVGPAGETRCLRSEGVEGESRGRMEVGEEGEVPEPSPVGTNPNFLLSGRDLGSYHSAP